MYFLHLHKIIFEVFAQIFRTEHCLPTVLYSCTYKDKFNFKKLYLKAPIQVAERFTYILYQHLSVHLTYCMSYQWCQNGRMTE